MTVNSKISRPASKNPIRVPSKFYRTPVLAGLAAVALTAGSAKAADVLPSGATSLQSTGRVGSARGLDAGELATGLSIDGARDTVTGRDDLGRIQAEGTHQARVQLGIGLAKRLELGLGVKGTYERISPAGQRALFATEIDDATEEGGQVESQTTAFTGATGSLKLKVVDGQQFKLSLLAFGEGGAGSAARLSVTRSSKPKAGWLTLMSYGERGVAEMTLSGGMRYRDAETLGDLRMRHEVMYGGSLRAWITKKFDVFTAFDGRRLMISEIENDEWSAWRYQDNGLVTGGIGLEMGRSQLALYAGQSVKPEALGSSKSVVGMSLTYSFGSLWGNSASGVMIAKEPTPEQVAPAKNPTTPATEELYLDANGQPLDVFKTDAELKASDGADDFDMFKAETLKRKDTGINEDQKADEELARLREADAKVEAEKTSVETERQRMAKEKEKSDAIQLRNKSDQLRREVKGDVDRVEGVGDADVSWQGLE